MTRQKRIEDVCVLLPEIDRILVDAKARASGDGWGSYESFKRRVQRALNDKKIEQLGEQERDLALSSVTYEALMSELVTCLRV